MEASTAPFILQLRGEKYHSCVELWIGLSDGIHAGLHKVTNKIRNSVAPEPRARASHLRRFSLCRGKGTGTEAQYGV